MSDRKKFTTLDRPLTFHEFFVPNIFSVKVIVVLAALLAIRMILGLPFLTIYMGPGFKLITFAYITDALAAMFYGPLAGLAFGFAGDFLGIVANGSSGGAYFPGFAVSEMVTCFIFAWFFFRRKITLPRTIIAWLLNLFLIILGLNSLWLIIMYGMSAGEVFAALRILNNSVQSPLHIAILYLILSRIRKLDSYLY